MLVRRMLSRPGRRSSFKQVRRSSSVNKMWAQFWLHVRTRSINRNRRVSHLADVLKNGLNKAQVADMEDGEREPDMSEVAGAVLQEVLASLTLDRLA